IDNVAPSITTGTINACYQTQAAAEADAIAATSATDNSTACGNTLVKSASTVSDSNGCSTITVTVSDGCNSASTSYTTRIDATKPMVTKGSIAACYQTQVAGEAAAVIATTATDNSTACGNTLVKRPSKMIDGNGCATIAVTVSDGCNSDSVSYSTRIDNVAPSITTGTINACYQTQAAAEADAIAATSATDNSTACGNTLVKSAST